MARNTVFCLAELNLDTSYGNFHHRLNGMSIYCSKAGKEECNTSASSFCYISFLFSSFYFFLCSRPPPKYHWCGRGFYIKYPIPSVRKSAFRVLWSFFRPTLPLRCDIGWKNAFSSQLLGRSLLGPLKSLRTRCLY